MSIFSFQKNPKSKKTKQGEIHITHITYALHNIHYIVSHLHMYFITKSRESRGIQINLNVINYK